MPAGMVVKVHLPTMQIESLQHRVMIHVGEVKRLPGKIRHRDVGVEIDLVRNAKGAARNSPKKVGHSRYRDRQEQAHGQDNSRYQFPPGWALFPQNPHQSRNPDGNAEEQALVGPRVGQKGQPQAQEQCLPQATAPLDSGQRSQDERSADCRQCPSTVAVHPIGEAAKPHNGQQPTQQRPTRRQPSLQHPTDRRAHGARAEPYADPGVSGNDLAQSHDQALGGIVHRHVGGFLIDVDTLKVNPHRVSWIRQAAVRESIRCQQIAKIIMKSRLRNRHVGQQGRAYRQCQDAHHEDGQGAPPCQAAQVLFRGLKPPGGEAAKEVRGHDQDGHQNILEEEEHATPPGLLPRSENAPSCLLYPSGWSRVCRPGEDSLVMTHLRRIEGSLA